MAFGRWSQHVHFVAEAHHLAWSQYPLIWLCVCFAILWLVLRSVRSRLVRGGVLMMLCGLMLNALVTDANAGHMPVVGMPAAVRPANATWQAATASTQLAFLADQRRLGLFSLGDLVLLFGGMLVLGICARRLLTTTLRRERKANADKNLDARLVSVHRPALVHFRTSTWCPEE